MDEKMLKKIIEAALFMSPAAIQLDLLAKLANTTVAQVRVTVNELIHEYEERDTALELVDSESGIKMAVKPEFQEHVAPLTASPEFNQGVMKTLAYISFKQPVKQTELIKFRNNKGYDHVKVLEERGFIRREAVGKSYIIYTTKKFLDYFGNQQKTEKKN